MNLTTKVEKQLQGQHIVWLLAGKGTGGRIRIATADSEDKARSVAALKLSKLALELTRSQPPKEGK